MVKQNCVGVTGWFLGHNYNPAFDKVHRHEFEVSIPNTTSSALAQLLEASADRIYAGHVCTRCGHFFIKEQ